MVKGQRKTYVMKGGVRTSYCATGNNLFITRPYELHTTGHIAQNRCEFFAMQLDLKEHDNFLGLNQHYSNILCHRLLNMDQHLYHVGSSQISMLRTAFNLISYGTEGDSIAGVQYLTCVLASLNYLTAVPAQEEINEQLNSDIGHALKYIEQNIESPITLQELAQASNYSLSRFKAKFKEELGITPDDINSIDDIVKLPFTTKYDLRDNYPFGLCAVPMSQIVRIHASSGTTGKPTVVGYTRKDLSVWSECLSRAFTAYGAGSSDIFQISYGYGLFTGGLGAHAGAENIGASVIPMSSGNTEKQITLMHDFGSTVLCCTPSYALYLADAIKDSGFPREEFKLKFGAFGAEPWTENMRRDIEAKLGIKAYDIYGLSEIAGPGVGYECECQHGTHLNEDHYFPEIVDPNTLEPVAPGETGELVFTHLTKEGMPLLRYRTKDLTALHYDKCPCGRTLVRMDRILGRSDDMLIIRGVNVFPTQIESVILEMPEFEPHYLLLVDRKNNTDTMELQVEVRPEYYSDEINKMLALKKKLTARLQSVLGLGVDVRLVEPRSIERSVGKAKRVIDNRKL